LPNNNRIRLACSWRKKSVKKPLQTKTKRGKTSGNACVFGLEWFSEFQKKGLAQKTNVNRKTVLLKILFD
jgi:hypothetical protein